MPQKITDDEARKMVCPIMTTSVAIDKPTVRTKGATRQTVDRRVPCHGKMCPLWDWEDPPRGELADDSDPDGIEEMTTKPTEKPDDDGWLLWTTHSERKTWRRAKVVGPRRGYCSYGS